MIGLERPRIDDVEVQHALALPDGRTPVVITVTGWGFARIGATRRWFWGRSTWRALVPVPCLLTVRLRNLWGRAEHRQHLGASVPATPRVPAAASAVDVQLRPAPLRADLRLPAVPCFVFSFDPKEPSHE